LRHPSVTRNPDDTAIAQYLSVGYVPAPRSAFAAIRKVPAGHRLIYRDGSSVVQRYWHLSFAPKLNISREEAADEFRRLLDQAVRMRLMADVPLGAFLSGGLDSSTIVAFMAEHSSVPVKTFSIGFRDQRLDELSYARTIADTYDTDHHEFVVDASETSVLPMLVRHLGEPFFDPSIVPTYHVARITRAEVTVALTGDGGDELLAGYDRYKVAALAHATVDRFPKAILHWLGAMTNLVPVTPRSPRSIRRLRRLLGALSLSSEKRHLSLTSYFTGPVWQKVVGPRLQGLADDFVENQLREASDLGSAQDAAERFMASDIATYLPDDLLVKMDIATMANSLESRAPFLDHELAEFVARLPTSYKLSFRTSKLLLRRAMRGKLPDRILARGKMGFSPPVADWLRGPLREMVDEYARSSIAVDYGYTAPGVMLDLFENHDKRRADNSAFLWSLLILELWLRECVQSPSNILSRAVPTLH
jgi:asparagine synthase (glutamine-hydrolysing)